MLITQSCLTLCNPMNYSPAGFSFHETLQARILEWVAISFSRGSSQPRHWTLGSCIADRFFTIWATRKAPFSSVQSLSCVQLFMTSWVAGRQASLSINNSQSLLKFMSIELVMPSNHLILYLPLLFLPSMFPSIRVFSNESVICIRWPKYEQYEKELYWGI